eukprot:1179830-Pleurochrysis_carterae.AAC.1
MCNRPEGRKRLMQCWCCPTAFCNKLSCLPAGDKVSGIGVVHSWACVCVCLCTRARARERGGGLG